MELILDVVLIALIALMVVLGIKRGLVKTCVGLVSTILVLVVAIFAVTPLTNLVMVASNLDESLQDALETPLADGKLPNAYAKVYYFDLDGEGKELIYEKDGEKKPFDTIFEEKPVLNFLKLSNMLEKNIDEMLKEQAAANPEEYPDYQMQENTIDFVDGVTAPIVTIVFTAGMFIILLIVTRILIAVVLKLLQKIISRLYVVHFVDKMLGGVFGLVAGALFVLILLTIVQLLSQLSFMATVNDFISNTVVTQFLMDNNFIYDFLVEKVNLGEIMGNLGK